MKIRIIKSVFVAALRFGRQLDTQKVKCISLATEPCLASP